VKKVIYTLFISTLVFGFVLHDVAEAQKKRGQTTMKFLSAPLSARASGMGDALTAVEGNSMSIFYNPAGTAFQNSLFDVSIGNTTWIADIDYQYASMTFAPKQGLYGVFGMSFMSVDYGDIPETIRNTSELGYEVIGSYNPNAVAFGLSYARAISTQFSVGANVRYVDINLVNAPIGLEDGGLIRQQFDMQTYTVDFGVLYKTGFKSLNFAMSVRNYSNEVTYIQDTQELPLTFRIGLAMNVLDFTGLNPEMHKLLVSVDANRPRDYNEQVLVGAEYGFMDRVFLRSGYTYPTDEQGLSMGVGVNLPFAKRYGIRADYSHTAFGVFNSVNRLSVQLSF
jgi:opacity protein-like surface antigen